MPDVEDEHDPKLVAVVPGLVLDGVVEDPGLPGHPLARLVTHSKAARRGTMRGRCVTRRTLVTPVCGGMRVRGLRSEYIAAGVRPA